MAPTATPPISTRAGCSFPGRSWTVNHFRHLWGEWHAKFILGFTLDAAGIRAEIANGQFKVVGPTELHGQRAIELKINVPPNNEAPPHVTAARLWVDATTYLPMQEFMRMSNGQQNVTDYTFLPPTAGNLAKLRPVIPAGYTRAGRTQVTGPEAEDDQEVADSATGSTPGGRAAQAAAPPGANLLVRLRSMVIPAGPRAWACGPEPAASYHRTAHSSTTGPGPRRPLPR